LDRVRSFELQYKVDDKWNTLIGARKASAPLVGRTIGESLSVPFKRVKARHVRLHIVEATEGPTLWEFQQARARLPRRFFDRQSGSD
jgi:hypothetical protein